uniref:protein-glutamine gamma-glutamyltransferase n=1 Tax=Lygus hesperus TaxID=30085 RepID=A0A0K8TAB6_LYGHE
MSWTCSGNECWRPWRRRTPSPWRRRSMNLPRPPTTSNYTSNEISDESKQLLQVKKVDALRDKNGTDHKTELYELMWRHEDPHLVVRRGQPFSLKITLSRSYNPRDDAVSFIFTMSDVQFPNHGQGTLVAVPLVPKTASSPRQNKYNWMALYEGGVDNTISVQIVPAVNCLVGRWSMEIDTKLSQSRILSYKYSSRIYILFNPWASGDEVHVRDEEERSEYVLTESGLIYRGTHKLVKPTVWKFSQFDKDILDCCLMLIRDVGKVPVTSWNDPIKISRAMSAAINSPDDNGVVAGNWSEDFGGGADPWSWVGSKAILQKYFAKKKPVKYGQCWVFAGVLTTVCRALGIPARPVTCYSCGHDTKNSLTLDYFFDNDGKSMDELQQESIWNFHVWVEVWMKRPDIGKEFDGWQVIDATPQELSDDQFRCGPTSVHAIKMGQIQRPYDGAFVFSMVNADVVYWQYYGPTQPLKLVQRDTKRVGKNVVTKAIGDWGRVDITSSYKHPETSLEERSTMFAALKRSGNVYSRYYLNEEFNDIKFDFQLVDDIVIGSSFRVVLKLRNKNSTKDYRVTVNLSVAPVIYTGKPQGVIKTHQRDLTVERKTDDEITMDVSYNEYADKLVSQCSFNITCHAHVKDIDFDYHAEDDFRVRQPDIKLSPLDKPVVGAAVRVNATFVNPLPVAISKGFLTLEGGGVITNSKKKIENIPANTKVSEEFILHPKVIGRHTLVAKFTSKELDDVDGFLTIHVDESNETG